MNSYYSLFREIFYTKNFIQPFLCTACIAGSIFSSFIVSLSFNLPISFRTGVHRYTYMYFAYRFYFSFQGIWTAGYGSAIFQYIQLFMLCYQGQSIFEAVCIHKWRHAGSYRKWSQHTIILNT